jgi:hypothetical protein
MAERRQVTDYALQRRATLAGLLRGVTTTTDVCDADPYLLRAARFHGLPTRRPCPVCRRGPVTELSYTFGDELGQYSGRLKSAAELDEMATEHSEFRVYVVEVCRDCSWNHLTLSYVLGTGAADGTADPAPPARRRQARRQSD